MSQPLRAAWKFAILAAPLAPTTKLVAFVIEGHMSRDGLCWPSVGRIAREAGLKRRTVQYALADLLEHGLLLRIPRAGHSNHLQAVVPPVHGDAPHPCTGVHTELDMGLDTSSYDDEWEGDDIRF